MVKKIPLEVIDYGAVDAHAASQAASNRLALGLAHERLHPFLCSKWHPSELLPCEFAALKEAQTHCLARQARSSNTGSNIHMVLV